MLPVIGACQSSLAPGQPPQPDKFHVNSQLAKPSFPSTGPRFDLTGADLSPLADLSKLNNLTLVGISLDLEDWERIRELQARGMMVRISR